jgi:hypothetical protein
VPYGGIAGIGALLLPEKGAGVWVSYEAGNSQYPLWKGCWFASPDGETESPTDTYKEDGTPYANVLYQHGELTVSAYPEETRMKIGVSPTCYIEFSEDSIQMVAGSTEILLSGGTEKISLTTTDANITVDNMTNNIQVSTKETAITINGDEENILLQTPTAGVEIQNKEQVININASETVTVQLKEEGIDLTANSTVLSLDGLTQSIRGSVSEETGFSVLGGAVKKIDINATTATSLSLNGVLKNIDIIAGEGAKIILNDSDKSAMIQAETNTDFTLNGLDGSATITAITFNHP